MIDSIRAIEFSAFPFAEVVVWSSRRTAYSLKIAPILSVPITIRCKPFSALIYLEFLSVKYDCLIGL